jgi:LPXTG-site transpeptidase (sortase) family protein
MRTVFLFLCGCLALCAMTAPALAVDNYYFSSENPEEFYQQHVHNSDFGTAVIEPEGQVGFGLGSEQPKHAAGHSGGGTSSAPTTVPQGGIGSSGTPVLYPDAPSATNVVVPQYALTPVADVRKADGSIGVLKIPAIGLNVTAYDGEVTAAMLKGVGHMDSTSSWLGTVGLCGHNRGVNNNFGKLKNLRIGDEITYTTSLGTKTYVVTFVGKIASTDWSYLQYTTDNRITLLTCVENQPQYRQCVQGVEKK